MIEPPRPGTPSLEFLPAAASTGVPIAAPTAAPCPPGPPAPRPAEPARRSDDGWLRALLAGSPHELLERVVRGDPCELRRRVAEGLLDGAFLLDAERVFLRVAARVAAEASSYRGEPQVEAWLDQQVQAVLAQLTRASGEAPEALDAPPSLGAPVSAADDGELLAAPLGIEGPAAARILRAFNRRSKLERRAFFDVVLHGRGFDSLGGRAVAVARRARATLLALLEAEGSVTPRGGH